MDELIKRGVSNIIPGEKELKKALESGKKLNVYLGIDPTATKIHLGHAMPLRKLQQFSDLGHKVTFLIGDFTALIGDTSDKDSERPALSREEIEENFKTYKEQAEKILDFSKVEVKYNSEWLGKLNFEEIVRLSHNFSAGDFLGREPIKKRLSENKRVGLHELLYPVMQGYDSYFLDTDLQIGGADQVFNMQAGRTLQKNLRNKDSFVLCTDYLMGTDGRKMSKSWGNAIWLTDEPFEMYRKVMAINDDQIKNYFLLATDLPLDKIPSDEEISNHPLETKKQLAKSIVGQLHSEKDANSAGEEFERVVQRGEIPQNVDERDIRSDQPVDEDLLLFLGLANSKSEAKRLFEQNGVALDGVKIRPGEALVDEAGEGLLLSVGKKMVKLRVNE
jgi:tyrosyl-tRNA synthetase